jgi:copper chaperone
MKKVTIDIAGMHCGSCVARVERSIADVQGVHAIQTSLERGQAEMSCDPTLDTTQVTRRIEEQGYVVTNVNETA